jgi:succinyl-CoA synthetase alpha subunit
MSIWVNKDTKIIVQGLTGSEGRFHAEKCREYGAQIVAGVTPARPGRRSTASRCSTPSRTR